MTLYLQQGLGCNDPLHAMEAKPAWDQLQGSACHIFQFQLNVFKKTQKPQARKPYLLQSSMHDI
jgi:hypothetical protein